MGHWGHSWGKIEALTVEGRSVGMAKGELVLDWFCFFRAPIHPLTALYKYADGREAGGAELASDVRREDILRASLVVGSPWVWVN